MMGRRQTDGSPPLLPKAPVPLASTVDPSVWLRHRGLSALYRGILTKGGHIGRGILAAWGPYLGFGADHGDAMAYHSVSFRRVLEQLCPASRPRYGPTVLGDE